MSSQALIDSLYRKYNAENDIIPNTPRVTASDMDLVYIVEDLLSRIEDLEREVSSLRMKQPAQEIIKINHG